MLGWEYPPYISGGLGTACEGLSKALSAQGVTLDFVVPKLHGGENAYHMNLIGADKRTVVKGSKLPKGGIRTYSVPAFLKPYWGPETYSKVRNASQNNPLSGYIKTDHYGSDLFSEVSRYTNSVVSMLKDNQFDIVHAHDWMTYPAGAALAEISNKPLVTHVHSLEYDRSGEGANHNISAIENMGLHKAKQIVAVSHYTKSIIATQHQLPTEKIKVVHNGVYPSNAITNYQAKKDEKVVLFMGRITFQKGPEYFVKAAAKVLKSIPDATFVMAGDGDMLPHMKQLTKDLKIENNFEFPGFLRGAEVERMYTRAAVYVMPSVSEPFGIAPLEAIRTDTPVIISRQSGVSEVLRHALKVDFWDTDKLAQHIKNALLFPELRHDMISMAQEEVKQIRWESAAQKLINVYQDMI